jgi:hypothetical protein
VRRTVLLIATALTATTALAGCSSSAQDSYADSLKKAGFTDVKVERDMERKSVYNKKKKKNETKSVVVAYDFDWRVNTDSDDATCVVELEHAANSSGRLTGGRWYIDEVNGSDVNDSPASPNPDAVRAYLTSHNIDC